MMFRDNNTKKIKKKIIGCFCFAAVAAGAVLAPAAIFSPNSGLTAGADTTMGASSSDSSQSYRAEVKLDDLLSNYINYKDQNTTYSFPHPSGVTIKQASYKYTSSSSTTLEIYEITLDSGNYKFTGSNEVNNSNVDVRFIVESGSNVSIDFENVTIINDNGEYHQTAGLGVNYYSKKEFDQCIVTNYAIPFYVKDGGTLSVKGTLKMDTYVLRNSCYNNGSVHEYIVPLKDGSGSIKTDFTKFTFIDGAGAGIDLSSYHCKKSVSPDHNMGTTPYPDGTLEITLNKTHTDNNKDGMCDECGSSSSTPSRPSRPTTPPAPKPIIGGKERSWSDIAKEISSLEEGSEYTIELNGITDIPENVIKAIAEKKIKTTFVVGIARQFYVDGADISEPCAADLTMDYSNDMKADELRGIVGVRFTIHDTNIPTDVNIIFKEEHAGKFANLYKEQDGKAVYVGTAKIADDGTVVLSGIKDAGDYVVMICEFSDLPGDMDNDGVLSAKDALAILKHSAGAEKGVNPLFADINGDGIINSKDALAILKISAGLV